MENDKIKLDHIRNSIMNDLQLCEKLIQVAAKNHPHGADATKYTFDDIIKITIVRTNLLTFWSNMYLAEAIRAQSGNIIRPFGN